MNTSSESVALTKGRATAFGAVGLVVFAALLWLLVVSPRLGESAELREEASLAQVETAKAESQLATLQQQVQDAPTAATTAQALLERMPASIELPQVITIFTEAATQAGIAPGEIQSFTTGVPRPVKAASDTGPSVTGAAAGLVAQADISLSVKTTRANFKQFVANLQNLDRIFVITSIAYTERVDADEVQAQIKGNLFILQSEIPNLVEQVETMLAQAYANNPIPPTEPDTAEIVPNATTPPPATPTSTPPVSTAAPVGS